MTSRGLGLGCVCVDLLGGICAPLREEIRAFVHHLPHGAPLLELYTNGGAQFNVSFFAALCITFGVYTMVHKSGAVGHKSTTWALVLQGTDKAVVHKPLQLSWYVCVSV